MDNSTYIKLLIDKSSPLEESLQSDVLNFLFETFVQYQKDTLYIYDGIIKRVKSKQAFSTMVRMAVKIEFNIDVIYFDSKAKKKKELIRIDDIFDTITTVNSYDLLIYESNLFAERQEIIKDDFTGVIKVIGKKVHIKEIKSHFMQEDDYLSIVDDYKKHFPYFDELLDLIIDMRFAKDRKASFLHFRVKSDWGKSFLSGLLKNLEIAIEIDYHNLMNKGANDISPIQVRNSFVMIIDEFNNFSQEMKKLSHSFTFAPKFGMSETVELYLKILLSAEKSPSFTGGVDDQIINRVMVFDIPDNQAVKLVEREEYIYQGNAKYMRALEHYALNRLRVRFDDYINMDELQAHKKADDRVRNTYELYKMKAESLISNVADILNDTIYDIANHETNNPILAGLKTEIEKIKNGVHTGNYFVGNISKVFETILKVTTSENEFKKMKYKLNDIENILCVIEDRREKKVRINGETKQRRGLIISIEEPKEPLVVEYKDKSGKITKKESYER